MTRMALDVTITDQDGKEIFSRKEEFSVNDFYFKGGKNVPMPEWDVTATEHYNLGLDPLEPYTYTYIVPLKLETASVDITALVTYLYTREEIFTVQKISQKVVMD